MSALLNPKNITTARTADSPVVRTAKPRMTTLKLRGTKASTTAANSGRQKINVSMVVNKVRRPKSEGRNPASRDEGRSGKFETDTAQPVRISSLEFLSDFGFRISSFGANS